MGRVKQEDYWPALAEAEAKAKEQKKADEKRRSVIYKDDCIRIRGAHEHNLKGIDLDIPRNQLVVLTGRLSIREEEDPKLLVETVTPLEDWNGTTPAQQRMSQRSASPTQTEDRPAPRPKAEHRPVETPQLTDAQLAQKAAKKLYLKLPREEMEHAMTLLGLYPGSIPVYLHIPAEKITLLAPRISWCDGTAGCIERMNRALGAENVKLVEK